MLGYHGLLLFIAVTATLIVLVDELFDSGSTSIGQKFAFSLLTALTGLWRTRPVEVNQTAVISSVDDPQEQFVSLPIDHNNPHNGTFQNRFWVNSNFYRPGGPVFVHDVGESDAESAAKHYLGNGDSYLKRYLEEFRGIGIVWEHRYYGKSLPFPVHRSTPTEHFRHLSLEQALADLPFFARNFGLLSLRGLDLTPTSTPWVMIGCSYSGLRAALSRQRYPDTFHMAYAASAPVQLQVGLHTFFDSVFSKLVHKGYEDCAKDLHAIMQYLDIQLSTPRTASIIKRRLLGHGAETNSNGDFALAIGNIYSYFQSSGITGGKYSLNSLCEFMESELDASEPGARRSMTARYGAQSAFERFATWPGLMAIINDHFATDCGATSRMKGSNCSLGQPDVDVRSISWTWQMCSELGLFAIQNSGPNSLVSRYLSLEYRQKLCARQFPQVYSAEPLPALLKVDGINHESGGSMMRPSNVFWSAGQYDPWRGMTTLASEGYHLNPDHVVASTDEIPLCNVSTGIGTVFGHVIADEQHCADWSVKSNKASTAREHFSRALRSWLPCFTRRADA